MLATVCIAIVSGLGITLYTASEEMEQSLVEQLVSEELESFIRRARASTEPVFSNGPHLQYYLLASPADHEKIAPNLRGLGPGYHEVGSDLDERKVAVREVEGTRYVVVYDVGPHEVRESNFRRLVYLSLATVALISVFLGYWLAGVLTRQLTDLAARVTMLAPDEPHPKLEQPGHDREVAALAHALDDYHSRLIDLMRREQEFTANASHELRTPLTAIRTSSELLAGEPNLPEKARARIGMIDRAARQMTERIEALLFLARRRRPEAAEPVALRNCVGYAAEPFQDEIARKHLAFEIAIPESEVLQLDRIALELVLGNLIKNAVQYTERGSIIVSYKAPRLTVADSGSGIAAHHLPQLFERYYRADDEADGLGLGLAIVQRICNDLGWKIEVESEPGKGSAFTIAFA